MRGEGQCLNVCVESWLEDWLSSVAIQQAAIQQALAGKRAARTPSNALFSNEQQLAEQMAALEQQYAARRGGVAAGNRGA